MVQHAGLKWPDSSLVCSARFPSFGSGDRSSLAQAGLELEAVLLSQPPKYSPSPFIQLLRLYDLTQVLLKGDSRFDVCPGAFPGPRKGSHERDPITAVFRVPVPLLCFAERRT